MKKIIAIVYAIGCLFSAMPALAVRLGKDVNISLNYGTLTGLGTRDLRVVIMTIINVILGFLGIVAIIGILYGGFQMMTAGGNSEQSESGKKAAVAGVIGLAIIFISYAIARFVMLTLVNVTQ